MENGIKQQLLRMAQTHPHLRGHIRRVLEASSELDDVLKTAINQLTRSSNGFNRLAVMINAKNFLKSTTDPDNPSITFTHMNGGMDAKLGKNAARTKLTYHFGSDDYTLTFYTRSASVIREIDGLYAENLLPTFEAYTGLALRI